MKTFLALTLLAAAATALPSSRYRDVKSLYPHLTVRPGIDLESRFGNRIYEGTAADISEYPFIAHLQLQKSDGLYVCGGSILREDTVITAAHCLDGVLSVLATAGQTNWREAAAEWQFDASEFAGREGYDPSNQNNDIGYVRFADGVGNGLLPLGTTDGDNVVIASIERASAEPVTGDLITAIGWGATGAIGGVSNTLNVARDLPVVDDDTADIFINPIDYTQYVCTYSTVTGVKGGTCGGDSGGPEIDSDGNLFGATSFGAQDCTAGPSCFTSLIYHADWIDEVLAGEH